MNESINKIKDYFVSMNMYHGRWVIAVKYRPKWGAYPPEDGSIRVGADEKEADLWWYCANNDDVTVDDIIDLIDETVQTNLEAIKKVELFKLKAGELKQLFSDETITYKKLQTLKFVFDDNPVSSIQVPKVKNDVKKKVASKKDLITQVGEEIQEHNVFVSTEQKTEDVVDNSVRVQKNNRKKRVAEEVPVVKTATPIEMTQDEIDDLRG